MPAEYHHGVEVIETFNGTRPIRTVNSAVIGIVGTAPEAEESEFPLNEPVLILGSREKAGKLGSAGTLPQSMTAIFDQIAPLVVVVRIEEGADEAATIANIVGQFDATTGQYTGLHALLGAKTRFGFKPRILGVPGYSHLPAVAAGLATMAKNLRGFAYVDAPGNSFEDLKAFSSSIGSKRVMALWPGFRVFDVHSKGYINQPASARALGMRAQLDNDIGWHKTISNVAVSGVVGLTSEVDWDLQSPNSQATQLNKAHVTTLIAHGGYRFWGSRTTEVVEPKLAFESTVRTGDILADTIGDAHMWAIDKPMSQTLITDIIDGVNAKFRELKAKGYIVNANCYLDPELNSKESLEAGKLWLNYDYTPVPPLEHLTFEAQLTNKYLVELLPGAKAA